MGRAAGIVNKSRCAVPASCIVPEAGFAAAWLVTAVRGARSGPSGGSLGRGRSETCCRTCGFRARCANEVAILPGATHLGSPLPSRQAPNAFHVARADAAKAQSEHRADPDSLVPASRAAGSGAGFFVLCGGPAIRMG